MSQISKYFSRLGVSKQGRVEAQMRTDPFGITNKQYYIDLFRRNGFNCFHILQNQKVADPRHKASLTAGGQLIKEEENYEIITIKGNGN